MDAQTGEECLWGGKRKKGNNMQSVFPSLHPLSNLFNNKHLQHQTMAIQLAPRGPPGPPALGIVDLPADAKQRKWHVSQMWREIFHLCAGTTLLLIISMGRKSPGAPPFPPLGQTAELICITAPCLSPQGRARCSGPGAQGPMLRESQCKANQWRVRVARFSPRAPSASKKRPSR